MEQKEPTLVGKLTGDPGRFAVACESLNSQMAELSSGEAPEMDPALCNMVFKALYDAVENLFRTFSHPWLEVTLKYIALYDETNYSPATGITINKVREQFVVKLSHTLGWNYYHRNWKRLMCSAAQLLLLTRDMRNEERERAISEAVVIRHRMSDRRAAVRPEELPA